jgi:hypothetical protein
MAALLLLQVIPFDGNAQLLKKLKDKAEQVANKAIDRVVDKKVDETFGKPGQGGQPGQQGQGLPGSQTGRGRSGNSNNSGAGLISAPPDVNMNLTESENAFKKSQFGEARYGLQQAMLGVELMMGKELMRSFPVATCRVTSGYHHGQG